MYGRICARVSVAIAAASARARTAPGVTTLTRASVHCADRIDRDEQLERILVRERDRRRRVVAGRGSRRCERRAPGASATQSSSFAGAVGAEGFAAPVRVADQRLRVGVLGLERERLARLLERRVAALVARSHRASSSQARARCGSSALRPRGAPPCRRRLVAVAREQERGRAGSGRSRRSARSRRAGRTRARRLEIAEPPRRAAPELVVIGGGGRAAIDREPQREREQLRDAERPSSVVRVASSAATM